MKKMILIYTLLTLIVGCASPRKYKENRFTKQFQEVDSMFNEKYSYMKIKYIRLKDKEHVCDYWLILAYRSLLQRARKSRKRKEFARRIIRLCKGSDKRITDISDDYRFWTAKEMYDTIVSK